MGLKIDLAVSRHQTLIDLGIDRGVITGSTPVVAHVSPEDVEGKHVFGVLPPHLAQLAGSVTGIPLDIPQERRGIELPIEELRQYAGATQTLVTRTLEDYRRELRGVYDAGSSGMAPPTDL